MNNEFSLINKFFLKAVAKHCNSSVLIKLSDDTNSFLKKMYSYILTQQQFNIHNTRVYIFQIENMENLESIMEQFQFNENQIITIINTFLSFVKKDFFECKKAYNINKF